MINRGEIWDIDFPRIGRHPGLVLTNQILLARLGAYTVAVITHTEGPASTHIPVGPEEGCDDSFINVTDLQTVRAGHFRSRRGEIAHELSREVGSAVIRALDLDSPL
ncbi:MAG: type II toxin-antitoxin system PemK/MazF family toxin [Candidatus Nanopelagicales bacterium]|nr:type II toxin-antitoxin system PemK/MazF family toxin [Candidatus Nanopelagicales bacterium]MDZ4248997.1 type II toxin-antitoxin system PemK/MazF family toxin [Candidatus Nanopelagicales bacterium]